MHETETDLSVGLEAQEDRADRQRPVLEIEKIKPSPGVRRARKEQVPGHCVRTSKIWNL